MTVSRFPKYLPRFLSGIKEPSHEVQGVFPKYPITVFKVNKVMRSVILRVK